MAEVFMVLLVRGGIGLMANILSEHLSNGKQKMMMSDLKQLFCRLLQLAQMSLSPLKQDLKIMDLMTNLIFQLAVSSYQMALRYIPA